MTFEEFKYNYWEVLIKYVSRYHPLSLHLVEQYKYVLDWRMLSANCNIRWDKESIQSNESKFTWHLLAANPSVEITAEFISKYKSRLDWNNLARNPNLPTNENFISEYRKNYRIDETHPNINNSFLERYANHIIPERPFIPIPEGIEDCNLDNFAENYKQWSHGIYTEIYDRIIKPQLDLHSISSILSNEITSQENYFYMKPSNLDKYGLIASFDPVVNISSLGNQIETTTIEFKQSNLQEGKDRIYSIISTRAQAYPCMLVSESLFQHLTNFKLPNFKILNTVLKTKKLKVKEDYLFLIFEDNTLIDECNYEHEFEFYFKRFSIRTPKRTVIGNSDRFKELLIQSSKMYSESVSDIITFYPKSVDIESNFDIYTLNRNIIISKRLGESLIKKGFGPIELRSTYPMILASEIESNAALEFDSTKTNRIQIAEDNYFDIKKKRLENHDPAFKKLKIFNDRMSIVEKKLNVIFPNEFKAIYLRSKLVSNDDLLLEEYNWLPIEEFTIENSYSDRHPEAYKSCLVAENGCGDYLALILEKEDDYKLDSELVTFKHESGEIERGKIQITIVKK